MTRAVAPPLRVGKFMTRGAHTIGSKQTLSAAHEIMRENLIRHLPVMERGEVVGIVSQRDLYLIETLGGVDTHAVSVAEAMSADPYLVTEDEPLEEVARVMADRKLGASVVVDREQQVVGVFTTTDALRALAEVLRAARHPRSPTH